MHVPFCEQRCPYCSFNTAPLSHGIARYLAALDAEIQLLSELPWTEGIEAATVFFGGGTPSILEADQLARVLDHLRRVVPQVEDAEISVEANPESVTRAKLAGYREAGVTRLSLGIQALDDRVLARLGRRHSARRAGEAFEAARAAGFTNVSVDLMYAVPGLDVDGWRATLTRALDWRPEHLSAYALTLDPGSLWRSTGVAGLPTEDVAVEQYRTLAREAAARGFEHYEVSNYARPGFRSRHNQLYWQGREYVGLGPGGCGFLGDLRYGNARATTRYCRVLESGALPVDCAERLSPWQRAGERLMLGLRLADGVPSTDLRARAAEDARLGRDLIAWRTRGLLVDDGERTRLTEEGFILSDALFVGLI